MNKLLSGLILFAILLGTFFAVTSAKTKDEMLLNTLSGMLDNNGKGSNSLDNDLAMLGMLAGMLEANTPKKKPSSPSLTNPHPSKPNTNTHNHPSPKPNSPNLNPNDNHSEHHYPSARSSYNPNTVSPSKKTGETKLYNSVPHKPASYKSDSPVSYRPKNYDSKPSSKSKSGDDLDSLLGDLNNLMTSDKSRGGNDMAMLGLLAGMLDNDLGSKKKAPPSKPSHISNERAPNDNTHSIPTVQPSDSTKETSTSKLVPPNPSTLAPSAFHKSGSQSPYTTKRYESKPLPKTSPKSKSGDDLDSLLGDLNNLMTNDKSGGGNDMAMLGLLAGMLGSLDSPSSRKLNSIEDTYTGMAKTFELVPQVLGVAVLAAAIAMVSFFVVVKRRQRRQRTTESSLV